AAAFGLWCLQLTRWTGDPFVFWTAKRAWSEVTILDLLAQWRADAMVHVVVAAVALLAIALAWRRLPAAWLVFAGLYLVPSLALGLVGIGRYAGECFPVVMAGGLVLAAAPRLVAPAMLVVSAATMALLGWVITTG